MVSEKREGQKLCIHTVDQKPSVTTPFPAILQLAFSIMKKGSTG